MNVKFTVVVDWHCWSTKVINIPNIWG